MQLKEQQQEALVAFKRFMDDDAKSVFILKGYAGTGKTTLLSALLPVIEQAGRLPMVMAPTGRAAKVLRDKTGYPAQTIHKTIYSLNKLKCTRHDENGNLINDGNGCAGAKDTGEDNLQFVFSLYSIEGVCAPSQCVVVVDEASLIGANRAQGSYLQFGSGVLLDDLLAYSLPGEGCKLLFVGDPAQLPPVGDNRSAALSESYFEDRGLGVVSYELTQVLRQQGGSAVLRNAMKVRDLLGSKERNELVMDCVPGEFEEITSDVVVDKLVHMQPSPAVGENIVVCYSNKMVHHYNQEARARYFPGISEVAVGDVLQVVKNNLVVSATVDFYNGDFVTVVGLAPASEVMKAPVWVGTGENRKRIVVDVLFRDVELVDTQGKRVSCKIVESMLYNDLPSLSMVDNTAIYINFLMRNEHLRKNPEALAAAMLLDSYYNALQVKFGYAVTAHKSQGGEWKNVIVDYSGRTGLDNDSLRWNYTATTRASQCVLGVNVPHVRPLDKFKINPAIIEVATPARGTVKLLDPGAVDVMPAGASIAQRSKYLSAVEALGGLQCVIADVSFQQYKDVYVVSTPSGECIYDLFYNGEGIYTRYFSRHQSAQDTAVIAALRSESAYRYDSTYTPSQAALVQLHALVMSRCDERNVVITGIVEEANAYKVTYGFRTACGYAYIIFYFNGKGMVTRAFGYSQGGGHDVQLASLLDSLNNRL
ncbi:MAG: AAA family ATPase [Muribaculaceae bacterium]|nr:AAA family ATPase [Muribaculaceae bacterium]